MIRTDETWHRLLLWTCGSAPSERLAAQILHASKFEDIDPTHPLGGPDGGKDALCKKDGNTWAMAVYFPKGQKQYRAIARKFKADLAGAKKNNVFGIAFVTNQEIADRDRIKLASMGQRLTPKIVLDLFHLERITTLLDAPKMGGVRQQFLNIPVVQNASSGADQELLNEFLAALPSNCQALQFLKEQDLGASFKSEVIDTLEHVRRSWGDATHEFLNEQVENQRKKFLDALAAFLDEIVTHAHYAYRSDWLSIGMDDYETRPAMFALRDKLNLLATAVYNEHQDLVRVARKLLAS